MSMFYGIIKNVNNVLEIAANLILLSVLWCICSLGLITILPASNALYKTAEQIIKYQDAYPVKTFFSYFRNNIGKKLLWGTGMILAGILICIVISCGDFMQATGKSNGFFSVFSRIVLVYYFVVLSYLITGLDLDLCFKTQIFAGLFYSVKNLPVSFRVICIWGTGVYAVIMIPICLLIVPGLVGWVCVYLFDNKTSIFGAGND